MPTPKPLTPSAPSATPRETGSASSRRFFAPAQAPRPLTLWGSSSMRSEGGAEATPLAVLIHEHLALANAPARVHAYGVGAIRSQHTLLMRGLLTPQVRVTAAEAGRSGPVHVQVEHLAPAGNLTIPGTLGDLPGTLENAGDGRWRFTPQDATARAADGIFTSSLGEVTKGSRQLLWMGKNNIHDQDQVLADTQAMWDAADDPAHDTIVMGHWATVHDAIGTPTARAVAEVNAEMARRYGRHFLDVQAELTGVAGLTSAPVAALRILEQATTQEALAQGVVPPTLVASDHIHLNGWGNLVVCAAIVRRMRELRWI